MEEVQGQHLADPLRVVCRALDHAADLLVQQLPESVGKALVRRVAHQRMPEPETTGALPGEQVAQRRQVVVQLHVDALVGKQLLEHGQVGLHTENGGKPQDGAVQR